MEKMKIKAGKRCKKSLLCAITQYVKRKNEVKIYPINKHLVIY